MKVAAIQMPTVEDKTENIRTAGKYIEKIKTVKSWLRLLRSGFFSHFFVMKGVQNPYI